MKGELRHEDILFTLHDDIEEKKALLLREPLGNIVHCGSYLLGLACENLRVAGKARKRNLPEESQKGGVEIFEIRTASIEITQERYDIPGISIDHRLPQA